MAEGSGERSPWRVVCEVGLSMFGFMHKNRMLSPSHYDMAMFEMKNVESPVTKIRKEIT